MARLTRLALALSLLFFVSLVSHADDAKFDTPQNAATSFMHALIRQDGKALLECLIKEERERFAEEFSKSEPPKEAGGKTTFEIGECKTDGDRARVAVKIVAVSKSGRDTDTRNISVFCAKEGASWRICFDETSVRSAAAGPDVTRPARESEGKAALGMVKDRCRVVYQRAVKAPTKLEQTGLTSSDLELENWSITEEFRVAADGKNVLIEARSLLNDDVLMVRFNVEDGKASWQGMVKNSDDAALLKDVQTLLGALRDFVRVAYTKSEKVPETITGDGKTLTSFDLVGEQWVARDKLTVSGKTVKITADCLNEPLVARLEFDVVKGGGEVKLAAAYAGNDMAKWLKARTEMNEMVKALNMHKLDTSDYPDKLDAIKDQFNGKLPKDPWTKKDYLYELTANGFELTCLGRDGQPGGSWKVDKDIIYTERGLDD